MDRIEKNQTWKLVLRPKNKNVIGTKREFINNLNADGKIVRNKVRLICKGHAQVEENDFEETFSLLAGLESIRVLLAFTWYKNFKFYQMDFK